MLYDPCHAKEKGGIGIHLGFFSFGHEPLVDSKADKAVAKWSMGFYLGWCFPLLLVFIHSFIKAMGYESIKVIEIYF